MAVGVVDELEVVEVEQDERDGARVPLGVGQVVFEALLEAAAVQCARQRVGARDPSELPPLAVEIHATEIREPAKTKA